MDEEATVSSTVALTAFTDVDGEMATEGNPIM